LIPRYALYLSFTGGPILEQLEQTYGARLACPLYCSVDPTLYYPERRDQLYDLGYMGTYSADRQPALERLLLEPAQRWRQGRFVVAGPQYPAAVQWPDNVQRLEHLPPAAHGDFYNAQRFTLNITRADMVRTGYAPSVRLFEAAACATPIISDYWTGLETFFTPGKEILISQSPQDTLRYLHHLSTAERCALGECARRRVLAEHTAARRAETLECYVLQALAARRTFPS
jgi:spore maturation protein CgeB